MACARCFSSSSPFGLCSWAAQRGLPKTPVPYFQISPLPVTHYFCHVHQSLLTPSCRCWGVAVEQCTPLWQPQIPGRAASIPPTSQDGFEDPLRCVHMVLHSRWCSHDSDPCQVNSWNFFSHPVLLWPLSMEAESMEIYLVLLPSSWT